MKLSPALSLPLTLFSCIFVSLSLYGQDKIEKQARLLATLLTEKHYAPKAFDDSLAEAVFTSFVEDIDPQRLYFTQDDIFELESVKFNIDDDFSGTQWKFFPRALNVYQAALTKATQRLDHILATPFDFTIDERVVSNPDKRAFAKDEKALERRWRLYLKYHLLWKLVSMETEKRFEGDSLKKVEKNIRSKLKEIEKRKIVRVLRGGQGVDNILARYYLNALTSYFDPHTSFLTSFDMANFMAYVSTHSFSFGFEIDENEQGEIEIVRLIPGGPAWRSGQLHKGDILANIQIPGEERTDLYGADAKEVRDLLGVPEGQELTFTIKKTGNIFKTITLACEKIQEDENVVKSYVIQRDRKIGYISLPGFYSEWENDAGFGCANDVAKELIKLKKENIDGLILDIRDNGGGSLVEGLNMAGIFINEGPLFVVKRKEGKPLIVKDLNRGTVYDGPLVVLVNGTSASASEILAAALQDYNRAVIIGSNTFGKATGQEVWPLDTTFLLQHKDPTYFCPEGYVKITVEKLYRVTGKSAQKTGVKPDIILPDLYQALGMKEYSYKNVLASDEVNKTVYYRPLQALPLEQLRAKSENRIAADDAFFLISKSSEVIKNLYEESQVFSLKLDDFRETYTAMKNMWEDVQSDTLAATMTVESTSYDMEIEKMNSYFSELSRLRRKNIATDPYVNEASRILENLIDIN